MECSDVQYDYEMSWKFTENTENITKKRYITETVNITPSRKADPGYHPTTQWVMPWNTAIWITKKNLLSVIFIVEMCNPICFSYVSIFYFQRHSRRYYSRKHYNVKQWQTWSNVLLYSNSSRILLPGYISNCSYENMSQHINHLLFSAYITDVNNIWWTI